MTDKKKCPRCGKEFEPSSKFQKFCCKDCHYQHTLEQNRSRTAAKLAKMVKICECCGAEFTPKKVNQKYCCPACANKGYYAKLNEERRQMRAEATCVICGKPTNRAKTIKYCSKECYIEARKRMFREARIKKAEKKPKKPVLSISEICRLAAAEHLTYGQYVEKYGV